MKSCKISIIVPVYNTEPYLRECMDSLISQNMTDIEIIAVNDGSTDNSFEILRSYQALNPSKVYVYNTENMGVSHARNFALEKASGEYVWFVDSDDSVEPNACKTLYNLAVSCNHDLLLFGRNDVDAQTREKTPNPINHYNKSFCAKDKPYEFLKLSPFPWNKLIKRELLDGVQFPEGIRFEDLPVSFIAASRAKSIGVCDECFYNYRVQVGFLSKFTKSTLDIVKAVEYLRNTLEKEDTLKYFEKEIEYVTVRHFLYRLEQLWTVCGDENYELKKELVNTLFDYLEKNYPDFGDNKYIKYNLPDRLIMLYDLYSSRENMLDLIEECRHMTKEEQGEYFEQYALETGMPKNKKMHTFDRIKERAKAGSDVYNDCKKTLNIEKCVLFVTAERALPSSIFALIKYFGENMTDYKITVAVKKKRKEGAEKRLANYGFDNARVVKIGGEHFVKALIRSEYIFSDCPLGYYYSEREGQKYFNLQTDMISPTMIMRKQGEKFEFASKQKSLMITDASLYLSEKSRHAYDCAYKLDCLPTSAVITPSPALDMLGASDIKADKKRVLFVPQFKAVSDRNAYKAYRKFMANMMVADAEISDDIEVYIDLESYPYSGDYSVFDRIKKKPGKFDRYDFASSCDLVVTDYCTIQNTCKGRLNIARLILDKKRFVTNEELEIEESDFPVFTEITALTKYINELEPAEQNIEKSQNCSALLNRLNASEFDISKPEDAVCLYYLGGAVTENRLRTFKRIVRNDPYKKYYLAFDEEKNADYKDTVLDLFKSYYYIPMRFDNTVSFDDKIIDSICSKARLPLGTKNKFDLQREKERRKNFGKYIKFDDMTLISTGEIARNLMFIGMSPKLEYQFNWFNADKYKNKKSFKCKVDFICKQLGSAAVIVPDEMKDLKALKELDVTVK